MRNKELLLVVLAFVWLLLNHFHLGSEDLTWGFLALSGAALVAHLWQDGGRWQMGMVYLVVICLVISHVASISLPSSTLRWVLFVLGLIGLLLSGALAYLLPVFALPKPTGSFSLLADLRQTTSGLEYKIWMPVQALPAKAKRARYHPQPSRAFQGVMGMPGFVFSHLKTIRTHANQWPVSHRATERFPLVIYSHGASSTLVDNTVLLEDLASQGYAVVALNHGFSFERYDIDAQLARKMEVAAQTQLIDTLVSRVVPNQVNQYQDLVADLEQNYAEGIDFSRIGILGHSLGGATATSGALQLPQVQAVVNMDGPIDPAITQDYPCPLLYFSSFSPELTDEELKKFRVPPAFYRGVKRYELKPVEAIYQTPSEHRYWARFPQANHLDFTDSPFLLPLLGGRGYDRLAGHQAKAQAVSFFFDQHLKGLDRTLPQEDANWTWLVTPKHSPAPSVE